MTEQIEHFWTAVARGWDIEPREYFEREAVPMGFKSPVEMAVHHMWKRHAKEWPNEEPAAALSQRTERPYGACVECGAEPGCNIDCPTCLKTLPAQRTPPPQTEEKPHPIFMTDTVERLRKQLDEVDEVLGFGYFPSDGTGRIRAIREALAQPTPTPTPDILKALDLEPIKRRNSIHSSKLVTRDQVDSLINEIERLRAAASVSAVPPTAEPPQTDKEK